ncbi:MAG: CopG family transcriptional regulator [Burkholderiaceae bacterium]|nr:CopG family transcriptional regulator [Burkholderiaceae bacterium]
MSRVNMSLPTIKQLGASTKAALVGLALSVGVLVSGHALASQLVQIKVYSDPNCGCCVEWVKYMQQEGFAVESIKTPNVAHYKQQYGVPPKLASCHTAVVQETGQVIEGHVPAAAVRKMLLDPSVKGVSAPGMPMNSPGMGQMDGNLVTVDFEGRAFSRD